MSKKESETDKPPFDPKMEEKIEKMNKDKKKKAKKQKDQNKM